MLRLIPMKELPGIVNLSRATIYEMLKTGDFVPPVELTPGRRAWRSDCIEQWINERKFLPSPKGGLSERG